MVKNTTNTSKTGTSLQAEVSWNPVWDLMNLHIKTNVCPTQNELCLLEVVVFLLVLLPLTHLQVSPSLKQVWGFHPGRQAERLVVWGWIPMAMFFPINHVSTRVVNWRNIIKTSQKDKQRNRKLAWLLCDGSTDATGSRRGNIKTVASSKRVYK